MTAELHPETQTNDPAPSQQNGCGCFFAPWGIVFVVPGVILLVFWYYGTYRTLEFARGVRVEPAIDFSRPGIHRRQFNELGARRFSLNLCFCEKNGPDSPPEVWRQLRFDACIRDDEGTVLISSRYRGGGELKPVRGIEVIDLSATPPEMVEPLFDLPLQIEVDVLEPVDEMREIPAALYFAQSPWESGGIMGIFGWLLQLFPGVLLILIGGIQLIGWAFSRRMGPAAAPEESR